MFLRFTFSFVQRVEAIEEAFSCVLVHQFNTDSEKITTWQNELKTAVTGLAKEQQEAAVRQFLSMVAAMTNHRRLQFVLSLLQNLVQSNVLSARSQHIQINFNWITICCFSLQCCRIISLQLFHRLVCECILNCDKLQYQLKDFWVECFVLIRNIIGGVDYKGVREIMKVSFFSQNVNICHNSVRLYVWSIITILFFFTQRYVVYWFVV